jgi:hypothetical protein
VRVVRSNDPNGRIGEIRMQDEPKSRDVIDFFVCALYEEYCYENGVRGSVEVTIR